MKIYQIDKAADNKLTSLGGKIAFDKLNTLLNLGKTILLRNIDRGIQTDLRIRKVPEAKKMDRGYKTIKAYYMMNLEVGKEGFDTFTPKEVMNEQNLRFHSLDRLLNMLQEKQNLKRADWIIEKK